jgi:hypothetical protein
LGYYAVLAKQLYPEVALNYTICELQPLVEEGRKLVADVEFTSDGIGSLKESYDLIYARSSLQYVRDFLRSAGKNSRERQPMDHDLPHAFRGRG